MVREELSRIAKLLGESAVCSLEQKKIAVFGLGGVGGHAAEALVRSGIGAIDIVDGDSVALSNINRQLIALHSTVGKNKTDVCAERFLDINPEIKLRKFPLFLNEETVGNFDFSEYDYVLDCIDDIPAKVLLASVCERLGVRLISSMGAGNKLNPMGFKVADIYETSVCPLARAMRARLRKAGVERLCVVYSTEEPVITERVPASCAYVPSAAGLLMASVVIDELTR
ncbi:MAG TPA: tRNA threonylcarbamoyladenosine dehydratase [Ruminococcaceae bacterium]|nr:tRNA threonylcarbamoyladenosine dehydratase [Oscillospiraceae bacterium]